MNGVARRIDQPSRDEDEQVQFGALRDFGLEQPADQRQVAEKRHLIVDFAQLLGNQSAENHGLTVPNRHAGGHVFAGEQWLLDVVKRGDHIPVARRQADRAAVIDEPEEL